ncbi:DNA primase [Lactococcus insecticola]|uniref:DNA primase n=1 Tax=Pseudolactococcus insecticola TaxID=2709158 RepID=A0A6A0B4H3_9LACT|nr:DNA primase [Lactococcus insecticola]GFH39603.1 DNA primase [Lactococcus insecticola]
MARLDKEKIADIKASVNIVDVISQYVHLSRSGGNFVGLCPFHGEKTPSFNVIQGKQFFHCFGCGKSGDVFKFLEEYKQESFIDAVKEVADSVGIVLDLVPSSKREDPNQALYELHNQAARIYHTVLTSTEEGVRAREYLLERGISDEEIDQFNIGLSLSDQDFLYQSVKTRFEEDVLVNSGLVTFAENRIFDSFRGRIMFPLNNEFGQVIAFSGRIWQPDDLSNKQLAKYKNSTTTPIFNKSESLYNLNQAKPVIKKTHEVYLMEGFMDVIAAYQNGISNAVASMGTALTAAHVRRLKQLTEKFVLVYDGDAAGQNAIFKALNLLEHEDVDVVRVPEGLDPDEYSKRYPDALAALMVNSRLAPVEFLIDYLRPENMTNLQSQLDFIDLMAPKIAVVQSLTAQDAYIKRLVEILPDFEYNQVEQAVNLRRQNVIEEQNQPDTFDVSQFDGLFGGYDDAYDDAYAAGQIPLPPPDETNNAQQLSDFQPVFSQDRTLITASPIKKMSRVEMSEMQLLHRMVHHPSVRALVASEADFHLTHKRYQVLYDALIVFSSGDASRVVETADAEVSEFIDYLTDNAADDALETLYEILATVHVPDEVLDEEVQDLVANVKQAEKASQKVELESQLDQAKQAGNKQLELQLIMQLMALRQQDGV